MSDLLRFHVILLSTHTFCFQTAKDDRACENQLVLELGVDHFDFVKKLLDNRQMVYYCTRLKQADAAERQGIEQEMATSPELKPILDRLQEVDAGDIVTVSICMMYGGASRITIASLD